MAGFVLAEMGRVPEAGESFETRHARFTALETTASQVCRVGIELLDGLRINGKNGKNGHGAAPESCHDS